MAPVRATPARSARVALLAATLELGMVLGASASMRRLQPVTCDGATLADCTTTDEPLAVNVMKKNKQAPAARAGDEAAAGPRAPGAPEVLRGRMARLAWARRKGVPSTPPRRVPGADLHRPVL